MGRRDGVQPANIVGAIAHTADLAGSQINGVDIRDDHTLVRLPAGITTQMLSKLRRVRVIGRDPPGCRGTPHRSLLPRDVSHKPG